MHGLEARITFARRAFFKGALRFEASGLALVWPSLSVRVINAAIAPWTYRVFPGGRAVERFQSIGTDPHSDLDFGFAIKILIPLSFSGWFRNIRTTGVGGSDYLSRGVSFDRHRLCSVISRSIAH
jgi:hypothetical protein